MKIRMNAGEAASIGLRDRPTAAPERAAPRRVHRPRGPPLPSIEWWEEFSSERDRATTSGWDCTTNAYEA